MAEQHSTGRREREADANKAVPLHPGMQVIVTYPDDKGGLEIYSAPDDMPEVLAVHPDCCVVREARTGEIMAKPYGQVFISATAPADAPVVSPAGWMPPVAIGERVVCMDAHSLESMEGTVIGATPEVCLVRLDGEDDPTLAVRAAAWKDVARYVQAGPKAGETPAQVDEPASGHEPRVAGRREGIAAAAAVEGMRLMWIPEASEPEICRLVAAYPKCAVVKQERTGEEVPADWHELFLVAQPPQPTEPAQAIEASTDATPQPTPARPVSGDACPAADATLADAEAAARMRDVARRLAEIWGELNAIESRMGGEPDHCKVIASNLEQSAEDVFNEAARLDREVAAERGWNRGGGVREKIVAGESDRDDAT